jgi:curved DNA-binding protein CbpA
VVERARAARVLGVDIDATPEQVRDAFRRRAREVHPDTGRGDTSAMIELNAAYEVLSARDGPDWQFATVSPADTFGDSEQPAFDDAFDRPVGRSAVGWFGIALLVAGVVMTTIVFVAAVGYDWSLSP